MMTLVTGGAKCGRSRFAEEILAHFAGKKIYLATMRPQGPEAAQAIAAHRAMRRGKGFATVEQYTDLEQLVLPAKCGVLLECVGNLCANEMFSESGLRDPEEKIVSAISRLQRSAAELVVVTSQVSGDGISYPRETACYQEALSRINRRLAQMADRVVECVYGIPVLWKGTF